MTCAGAQAHEGRRGEGAAVHTHKQLLLTDAEGAFLPVFSYCDPWMGTPKCLLSLESSGVCPQLGRSLSSQCSAFLEAAGLDRTYCSLCRVAVAAQSLVWSVCCVSAPMNPLNISLLICWQQPGQLTPTFLENCFTFLSLLHLTRWGLLKNLRVCFLLGLQNSS